MIIKVIFVLIKFSNFIFKNFYYQYITFLNVNKIYSLPYFQIFQLIFKIYMTILVLLININLKLFNLQIHSTLFYEYLGLIYLYSALLFIFLIFLAYILILISNFNHVININLKVINPVLMSMDFWLFKGLFCAIFGNIMMHFYFSFIMLFIPILIYEY